MRAPVRGEPGSPDPTAPVAIIGMACMFPQAPDLRSFWHNIVAGVDAVGEPQPAWDAERYLHSGRIKTQFGGYLKELFRFDPREFGIMPNSMDGGEPDQLLALRIARDALVDAGYGNRDFDHTDTGIVLGHSTYLHRGQVTVIQNNIVLDQTIALLRAALPQLDDSAAGELRELMRRQLPPTNADTAPGLVPNVMTGRIANRLDLRGPNYLVDAACASSLLAVAAAMDELRAGRSRMMLAGGVNASLPADVTTIFTQLGALSARGKVRPFEAGSDGTLLGEGLGVVVLKRLDHALADGDAVYAVLRGVGQSSDGRVTGLLAPSLGGETLAIRRAYDASGVDPDSVGLVEAHGTGIPLGDKTEIAALGAVFGTRTTPSGTKAIGSVKSMISHCIPAAGAASLIKMALSLHHRVLPPTLCEQVNPELGIDGTPFYVNTQASPWMARPGQLRRAAVNSFGFGGVNAHAIVEQAPAVARAPARLHRWPAELCVFAGTDTADLLRQIERVEASLERHAGWRIDQLAAALARECGRGPQRLAVVASSPEHLKKQLAQARSRLAKDSSKAWGTRGGAAYAPAPEPGRLAFLFPGEGSQYPAMFADLAACFDVMQQWLDFWHGLYGLPDGHTRTDIVFPSCEVDATRRKQFEQRMHEMDVGSESVFIGGMAMHELLLSLGIEPDVMMGHSSGESAALGASGANPAVTAEERAGCISRHYEVYDGLLKDGKIPTGALLAVGALPPDTVEQILTSHGQGVVVAMDNCSNQIVLYGSAEAIDRVRQALTAEGGICMPLPFDRGYHTPDFAAVSKAFLQYYKDVKLGLPKVPMYSCASADLFPRTVAAVRKLAAAQWSQKVRFRETVLKMHDDGVRVFVEVGPSANLSAFVNDILIDRDFVGLATNQRRKGGVEQLLAVLGQLFTIGRSPKLERLFGGRAIEAIDLDAGPPPVKGVLLDNTMPMVRLDEAGRAAVHRLVAPTVPAQPSTVDMPAGDPRDDAPAEAALAQVMAQHFDLMRRFLDHSGQVAAMAPGQDAMPEIETEASRATAGPGLPMLDEIVAQDASSIVARCRVSPARDAFMRDHVLSGPVAPPEQALFGLSCVPLMVSLELMAEACAALAGRTDVRLIEHVKAFDWIALDDGEGELEVRARVLPGRELSYAAEVRTARGTMMSAEFGFVADDRLPALAPLLQARESCLNDPHLYATGMFHGPVFQSMRHVQAWDDTGIDVEIADQGLMGFFTEGSAPDLVLNPVLLDAMGQLVACWLVQYVGTSFHSFPSTIGRIELPAVRPDAAAGALMRARQRPVDPQATSIDVPRSWQVECVDGEGRVLVRAADFVNLFFRAPVAYHEFRTDPWAVPLGAPMVFDDPEPSRLVWELPLMTEEFCAQSGAICLRVLAHALLAPDERRQWQALQGSPKRRREWLFGRAAVKEAVRHWVERATGERLFATEVEVIVEPQGGLRVDGWWSEQLVAAPRVSLSHNAECCVAVVAPAEQAVGIDMESFGRLRDPALVAQSFDPSEAGWLAGLQGQALEAAVLRLWCAKEAAAKCLGIGLQGDPAAFVVRAADAALTRLVVEHGQQQIQVDIVGRGASVVALAVLKHWEPEAME